MYKSAICHSGESVKLKTRRRLANVGEMFKTLLQT